MKYWPYSVGFSLKIKIAVVNIIFDITKYVVPFVRRDWTGWNEAKGFDSVVCQSTEREK